MRRVIVAALLVSVCAGSGWAQVLAEAEGEPPPGEALDAAEVVWALDIRAAFAGGLRVGDVGPFASMVVHRQGIVGFGVPLDLEEVARPRPLADFGALAGVSFIAPFWAAIDAGDCAGGRGANAVFALVEPGRVRVTWHEAWPVACGLLVRPVSFALEIRALDDDAVAMTFEYLEQGQTGGFRPHAGFMLGEVVELFRQPDAGDEDREAENFAVPADRAKALFENGSDGESGVWRFEFREGAGLVGDRDRDGIRDDVDNCLDTPNPLQVDLDEQLQDGGDACDTDDDGDLRLDELDNCPRHRNPDQADLDGDGEGDVCDADLDGDGWWNAVDNCPALAQERPFDLDRDGLGDACDPDVDGDDGRSLDVLGRAVLDNCPGVDNPARKDWDGDGIGDACDLLPGWHCPSERCPDHLDWDGDGVADPVDVCPWVPDEQHDKDQDGEGDACDPDSIPEKRWYGDGPLLLRPVPQFWWPR